MPGVLLATLLLALAAACSPGGAPGTGDTGGGPVGPLALAPGTRTAAPPQPGDWPVYHRDGARSGSAPGTPPPGPLRRAWSARLDGAVYGQPLVVHGRVIAATEGDSLYALDARTGKVLWRRTVGTPVAGSDLPCGNIAPLGITGTPAYDPATGLVFAVAEITGGRHVLVGVDPGDGRVLVRREAEPPRGDRLAHQQRGALAVWRGRVYIPYGGLDGDCSSYVGAVVSVPVTGSGPTASYAVPTARMGGIWAPGGPVVDGDRLLVSVGNGASTGTYDGSDSVVALDAGLRRTDFFAPASWAADNARDADLGSLTPVRTGGHILIAGKSGTGYVLAAGRLGGVGGQVSSATVCPAYGATATDGAAVYVPCHGALRQLTVDSGGSIRLGWRMPLRSAGSPVTGGGAVWVVDYSDGELYALDAATGAVRRKTALGSVPHFVSPVLSGGRVLVGTLGGVTALDGA